MPLEPDFDELLTLTAELGYRLQVSGAETYRVEESMRRIFQAYGAENGEVFAIPNCIVVSLITPAGQPETRIRRIPPHSTDIERLEAYNDMCRVICAHTPPMDQAWGLLGRIEDGCRDFGQGMIQLAGYLGGSWAFSLFFGGTWMDGICGGLCGLAIGLCLLFMTNMGSNLFFRTLAASAVSALLALGLAWAGLALRPESVIIGALMTLVPGTIITSAMRDIMAGDLIAGISRAAEALLVGTAIAMGTGFALVLAGRIGG